MIVGVARFEARKTTIHRGEMCSIYLDYMFTEWLAIETSLYCNKDNSWWYWSLVKVIGVSGVVSRSRKVRLAEGEENVDCLVLV